MATRKVSKTEFRRAMAELGFKHSRPHIDAVFESWDEDKSGFIEFKELNRALNQRQKGGQKGGEPPSPPVGAPSPAEAGGGEEGEGGEGKPTRERRRQSEAPKVNPEVLLQNRLRGARRQLDARVIDLFREWDENGDGKVVVEFKRALPLLGLSVDGRAANVLFNSFDKDGTGEITLRGCSRPLVSRQSPGRRR